MRKLSLLLALLISATGLAQDDTKDIPSAPGLYYWDASAKMVTRLEGQAVSFRRTGSLLAAAATAGIVSRKINVQILGSRSHAVVKPNPMFYYRAASGTEAAGGSVGDLVLVKLIVKGKRRQFEVGARGLFRASTGISIRSQLVVKGSVSSPGAYRAFPYDALPTGQYAFYLFRGYDLPGFVYDFMVE